MIGHPRMPRLPDQENASASANISVNLTGQATAASAAASRRLCHIYRSLSTNSGGDPWTPVTLLMIKHYV
jgi:hypothetical protein